MSSRRFEFTDSRSFKFWQITVSGPRVTVTFGRIGTDGQTQVKTFHSPEEASRHAAKVIAAKLKKGYVEMTAV